MDDLEQRALTIALYNKVEAAKANRYQATALRITDVVQILEVLDPSGMLNPSHDQNQNVLDLLPDAPLVRVRGAVAY